MKTASLVLNIFNVLVLVASVVSLLPTAMLFDAPGSTQKKSLWFLFWVFLLFPVVSLGSLATGWVKWGQGDYESALKAGGVAPIYGVIAFASLFSILEK